MKEAPANKKGQTFAQKMDLLKDSTFYPNMRAADVKGTPDQIARNAVEHMKKNMRFLYENAKNVETDKLWYDGARRIVDKQWKKYGYEDASIAGVYAALSPQKSWHENVYLGDRLIDIHSTQQKTKWNDKMAAKAKEIWTKPDQKKLLTEVQGKTLGELTTPSQKAVWIRTYDEAHSDRTFRLVQSNGDFGDFAKGIDGGQSKAAWQSTPAIAAAVQSLESKGKRSVISEAMGEAHKVRSFYNNILDPNSANGDVTSDTHHVGAAWLRSLGSKSVPVAHNFGNSIDKKDQAQLEAEGEELSGQKTKFKAAGSSKTSGVSGMYPLYAQATRELAADLGIQPRQLQSVIWVTKKDLFENASDRQKIDIERAWHAYNKGSMSLEDTQKKVLRIAQGLEKTDIGPDLMKRLEQTGGFTYNTENHTVPKSGFVVSPYKTRERIYPASEMKPQDFMKYYIDNYDMLSKAKHYFGAWHNKDDGNVYLDVAVVERTAKAAEKLSRDNDQLAYFDLKKMETINVAKAAK